VTRTQRLARDARGRYRFARLAGIKPRVAAWRVLASLFHEGICGRLELHEYEWRDGSLVCWICDHVKHPAAPGQHAGGDL
jgi:hypothetical protein